MLFYEKIKKVAFPVYLILLMLSFFYVKQVLSEKEIKVSDKKEEKVIKEKKPVVVYLDVYNFGNVTKYRARLENYDTVLDLFEYLRKEEGFTFTKEMHSYGIEFPSVNGIEANSEYKWVVYMNSKDITNQAHDTDLDFDEQLYELKFTRIEELQ